MPLGCARATTAGPGLRTRVPVIAARAGLSVPTMENKAKEANREANSLTALLATLVLTNLATVWVAINYVS